MESLNSNILVEDTISTSVEEEEVSTNPTNKWECMEHCPTKVTFEIIQLNHFEFMVPDLSRYNSLKSAVIFYKYNTYSNEWHKITMDMHPNNFAQFTAITTDKQNDEIYLFSATSLRKISIDNTYNNNKITTIKESHGIGDIGNEPSMVYINNILHIVGGDTNKCHYIYNMKTLEYELIHEFTEFSNGFSSHKLIYLKSIECLLLMGGYDDHERGWLGGSVDTIFMYSIQERKWNKLKETLPMPLYRYAYILTNNDEFVVLIGGNPSGPNSNHIYVMNVNEKTCYVSKIRFPEALGYAKVNAISVYDDKKDKYLACGYLRKYCQLFKIHIPLDVIQLIEIWIRQMYVYVISEEGKMWRIKLNELISSDIVNTF
eukprot:361675_1